MIGFRFQTAQFVFLFYILNMFLVYQLFLNAFFFVTEFNLHFSCNLMDVK